MLSSSYFRCVAAFALAAVALLSTSPVLGDTTAPSNAARDVSAPVGLVVFGDGLPRDQLRERLARELARPVVLLSDRSPDLVVVTVRWRPHEGELAVSYDEPGRGTVSRVVPAHPDAAQNVDDAVLLASSMARNDADELLGKETKTESPPLRPVSPRPAPFVFAYASLFDPIATNFEQPYARTRIGLNLLYGRAGQLDNGLQLGLVNAVVGKDGVASGDMSGVQLAPFLGFNFASGHATGLQLGWIGNVAGRGLEGGQMAFVGNVSGADVDGAQLAFGANVSTGTVRGVQAAAVNVARDLTGAQVGLFNVAKKVDGLTVGLINVADDIDGVPIGLVSVTRTGGVHPVVWGSSVDYANVGLKFATRYTYSILSANYTRAPAAEYAATGNRPALRFAERDFFGGGYFLGGHVPIDHAFFDFDIGVTALGAAKRTPDVHGDGTSSSDVEVLLEPHARVMGGYRLAPHASLFAGAGFVTRARIVFNADDAVVSFMPEFFGGVQF